MFSITVDSATSNWPVPEIQQLIATLVANPFAPILEMDLGRFEAWGPLNEELAAYYMGNPGPLIEIGLRSSLRNALPLVFVNLQRADERKGMLIHIRENLMTVNIDQTLLPFIRKLPSFLSQTSRIIAETDTLNIRNMYQSHQLSELPPCFGFFLAWYTLLSPTAYSPFYTKEALLAAPAYVVRELPGEYVEIIAYADPSHSTTAEAEQQLVTLTRYLATRQKS